MNREELNTELRGATNDIDLIRVRLASGSSKDYLDIKLYELTIRLFKCLDKLNSEQEVKASVATEEEQGVAADTQISLSEEAIIYRIVEQWGNALCPVSEMVKWLKDYRAAEVERLRGEREALSNALSELMDWQNGPPLPTYEKGWKAAMTRAEQLLAKPDQPQSNV